MTRIVTFVGVCMTAIVTTAVPASGQQITSPTANQVFPAGPDYASDVLHDPWDFSNIDDISPHPHQHVGWQESTEALSNGQAAFLKVPHWFTATSNASGSSLGLLYPGGAVAASPGRNGLKYPIDTSRYRILSFKMRVTGTPSHANVTWFTGAYGVPGGGTAQVMASSVPGDAVYDIDLGGTNWSDRASTGVRLDPSHANGTTVQIDWVRLTSAVIMPVSVSGCGGGSHDVSIVDATGVAKSVGSISGTSASTSVNYGIFPPGSYQVRVACSGGPLVQPFVINDPPRITVLDPDERGGADYAATVLGNPWDFEQQADIPEVANLVNLSAPPAPTGGHLLRASNSSNPAVAVDPQVYLLSGPLYNTPIGGPNNATPIATTRYRHLTYTLRVDAPFGLNGAAQEGSVARIIWSAGPSLTGTNATTSQDILIWPGRNTYTLDLGALTKANQGIDEGCTSPQGCFEWMRQNVPFLRIDPHEFARPGVFFELDNVTLATDDEVFQGQTFRIQWSVSGVGAGSVNLYYDSDTNPSNGRQAIVRGVPISQTSYDWAAGVAPGRYYIYVEVDEAVPGSGIDTRGAYSTGVLNVRSGSNQGVISIATHANGSSAYAPFNISGCAHNGAGGADSEVFVYAHPLQGQMGGAVQTLGTNPAGGLGTLAAAPCAGGLPGYQVSNIFGLTPGLWTFRVLGHNTLTGNFDEAQAQNVNVSWYSAPAGNLRASVAGNSVSLAWDPPGEGALTQYRIEAANNPSFAGFSWAVLPASQTSITATLPNGTYYIRVRTGNPYSNDGPPSNVINFALPGGGSLAPPGPITLTGQINANPVSLSWSQAGGGPATYALHAGSGPGASNIAVVPMGTAMSLPPVVVPPGVPIFARIVASNAAGSMVSNEIVVNVPAAGPPGGAPIQLDPVVSGHNVFLHWNPPGGGATPTRYVVVARLPGSSAVLATAPVTGTTLSVPGVPSGTYIITVVAMYGATPSGESNPKTLVVP